MGCANHKGTRIMPRKPGTIKLKSFTVAVENPESNEQVCFSYETENDELPIMQILNGIAFDENEKGNKFDGNFISILNDEKGEFEYYIQRLVGKEIDNENNPRSGKLWVPYINARREDWSQLCENNRIIAKEDKVIFRFEEYGMSGNFNLNGIQFNLGEDGIGSGNHPSTKAANSRGE